ncbi:Lrp/AsnC family transcriptional regulator [Halomicroarcula limicola]|uniref:Lrp/AsnC family transcriptional regulator n=1 Tax=Haloarcula limicola TaxID=1429915 RepID=A0A8J7YDM8_9EURY|nr:Lrp/AsnC family transcriptional regulator [Halomicroarcula limicola]MBV0926319.1 Lrp/AsnC family transcriptional regulator [Halomicroarcula limicola]
MDEKDIQVLAAIAKLGTGSPEKLSEETDIPKSTVHYRLDNLREEGVITNDLFDVDLTKVGLNITVITEVMAEYSKGYHDKVGEKLGEVEGVNQVYFTMGDTDFVVISHLSNRGMVENLIQQFEAIDEIARTSSKFVIKTIKDENRPLNDFEMETLVETLGIDQEKVTQ